MHVETSLLYKGQHFHPLLHLLLYMALPTTSISILPKVAQMGMYPISVLSDDHGAIARNQRKLQPLKPSIAQRGATLRVPASLPFHSSCATQYLPCYSSIDMNAHLISLQNLFPYPMEASIPMPLYR